MKKRKITALKFRKYKVSNLNKLGRVIGGTAGTFECHEDQHTTTFTGIAQTQECEVSVVACSYDCTSFDDTGCITNDATRSIGTPTFVLSCNTPGTIISG